MCKRGKEGGTVSYSCTEGEGSQSEQLYPGTVETGLWGE